MKKLLILSIALASIASVPAFAARPHTVTVTRRVVTVPHMAARGVVVKRKVVRRRPARPVVRVVRPFHPIHPVHPVHPVHPIHPIHPRRPVRHTFRR